MKYSTIITIFITFIYLFGCAERERTNPFDPKGSPYAPVEVDIKPQGHKAILSWRVQNITGYTGFRVYRAIDDTSRFEIMAELPPERTTFTDSALQYSHWYYYYITVLGKGPESKPSNIVKTFPGPGQTWILTRYGSSIHQVSYDLQHQFEIYNLHTPPISWDWDLAQNYVWLAHAQFRGVSRLNLEKGYQDFIFETNLKFPVDVKWDAGEKKVYALDSDRQMIFILQDLILTDSLLLPDGNYSQIEITADSRVWVMGNSSVIVFTTDGDPLTQISFSEGQQCKHIIHQANSVYLLTTDADRQMSKIFIYHEAGNSGDTLSLNGEFTILSKAKNRNYFWAAQRLGKNTYRLVKLSVTGERLLELSPVGQIVDIGINPADESVIAVQRFEDTITLYNRQGNNVSSISGIYDPIKVFIR